MKKFFLILFAFMLISSSSKAADDFESPGGYDFDYKFLDNPFAGQKMVSDKEFEQAVNQATPKKGKGGFFNWVFRNDAPEIAPTVDSRIPSEMSSIREAVNKKPVVILGNEIIDMSGNILPPGHYQVNFHEQHIELSQGSKVIGMLKARSSKDDWATNNIIYARVLEVDQSFIKIIHSNLEGTHEGFARIRN